MSLLLQIYVLYEVLYVVPADLWEALEYSEIIQEGENLEEVHEVAASLQVIECPFSVAALVLGHVRVLVEHRFVELKVAPDPLYILLPLPFVL